MRAMRTSRAEQEQEPVPATDLEPGSGARVAVLGTGRMGAPIAGRLAAAGYAVTGHDLRPECEPELRGRGVGWAADAVAAARGAQVLLTVLPGPEEVTAALTGPVLDALAPGAVWLDLSSNSPTAAARSRTEAEARGTAVLEAPMGGGPADAEAGRLRLFVGGDAALLDRCRPLLATVADPDRIALMGGPGTGYTVKLLVNQLWFGQAVATAEALLLGVRAGVDLTVLREALATGAASSAFIRDDLDALFAGDYLTTFPLHHIHHQLTQLTDQARALGTPHRVAETVRTLYAEALAHYGPADGELLAVALLEERSGIRLRPAAP